MDRLPPLNNQPCSPLSLSLPPPASCSASLPHACFPLADHPRCVATPILVIHDSMILLSSSLPPFSLNPCPKPFLRLPFVHHCLVMPLPHLCLLHPTPNCFLYLLTTGCGWWGMGGGASEHICLLRPLARLPPPWWDRPCSSSTRKAPRSPSPSPSLLPPIF